MEVLRTAGRVVLNVAVVAPLSLVFGVIGVVAAALENTSDEGLELAEAVASTLGE